MGTSRARKVKQSGGYCKMERRHDVLHTGTRRDQRQTRRVKNSSIRYPWKAGRVSPGKNSASGKSETKNVWQLKPSGVHAAGTGPAANQATRNQTKLAELLLCATLS